MPPVELKINGGVFNEIRLSGDFLQGQRVARNLFGSPPDRVELYTVAV